MSSITGAVAPLGAGSQRDPDSDGTYRVESAGFMVNLCARLFERAVATAVRPLGMTPAFLPVTFLLSDLGEASQSELSRELAVRQPTMAATLGRMQLAGLLDRSPDEHDHRVVRYSLTAKAIQQIPDLRLAVERVNKEALRGLTLEERQAYLRFSRTIAEALTEPPEPNE